MHTKQWLKCRTRAGGALVLVTIATSVAAVLGLSLLSVSSLQTRASGNAATVAEADYFAESGVNIAMYYLQNPSAYTGSRPNGYYPGEANLNLGPDARGTIATEVVYAKPSNFYVIKSTSSRSNSRGSTSRTIQARVRGLTSGEVAVIPIIDAVVLNADVQLDGGMTFTNTSGSGVRTLGKVRVVSGGRVNGDVVSDDVVKSGTGEVSGAAKSILVAWEENSVLEGVAVGLVSSLLKPFVTAPPTPTDPSALVTDFAHLPDLRSYRYKNPITGLVLTYNATKLTQALYSAKTIGPTLMNPAGIYWTDADVELRGSTVNGSVLLINGAKLRIGAGNSSIIARQGYPAVVSGAGIRLENTARLSVTGLTYASKIECDTNTNGSISIVGALMLSDTVAPIPTDNYEGTFSVVYDKDLAVVPGFGMVVADMDIKALTVVSWTGN